MATIEAEPNARARVAWWVLGGLAAIAVLLVALHYFTQPPQMGVDDDVFKTVDALYTAVRMKDEVKLGQCEKRLHSHRDAGKLPESPAAFLDGIIAKARAGKWDSATERLYDFMLAQRREGRETHESPKPNTPKKTATR